MSPRSLENQRRIGVEEQRILQGAEGDPALCRATERIRGRVVVLQERLRAIRQRIDSNETLSPAARQQLETLCAQVEQRLLGKMEALRPDILLRESATFNASIDAFLAELEPGLPHLREWRTGDHVVFDTAVGGIPAGGHKLRIVRDGRYHLLVNGTWQEVNPQLLPKKGPPPPLSHDAQAELTAFMEHGAPLRSDTIERSKRVIAPYNKEWPWRAMTEGRAFMYETPAGTIILFGQVDTLSDTDAHLIVNALLKQRSIATTFNLPADMVPSGFKVEAGGGDMMMNNFGFMFIDAVKSHVQILRERGASDADIMIELAGHIFHESVHDSSPDGTQQMFHGKTPLGEISTVTAQTAFYLSEGYYGPTSYEPSSVNTGAEKIRKTEGKPSPLDYDIATCVAGNLLHKRLQDAFPKIARTVRLQNPLEAAREICRQVPAADRPRLLAALRGAIADSCDPKVLQELYIRLKTPPPPPPPRIRAAQSAQVANIAATATSLDVDVSTLRPKSDIDGEATTKVSVGKR